MLCSLTVLTIRKHTTLVALRLLNPKQIAGTKRECCKQMVNNPLNSIGPACKDAFDGPSSVVVDDALDGGLRTISIRTTDVQSIPKLTYVPALSI